jgi:hypothetical protein
MRRKLDALPTPAESLKRIEAVLGAPIVIVCQTCMTDTYTSIRSEIELDDLLTEHTGHDFECSSVYRFEKFG